MTASKGPNTTDTMSPAIQNESKHELPRQFSLFSTLALGFSMTNSWLGFSATFITPLEMGGRPAVFFGLIVASIASCFITAGLAELSSAYPSSGGQYHYAFMVSAPKYQALVAFVMGWLSVVAWCLTSASTAIVCAQMVGNLASMYHPTYTVAAWQTYLIYLFMIITATSIVCFCPRTIPRGEIVLFYCSFFGFLASFITVLAMQPNKATAKAVFVEYQNDTGWSDGTSFMIGVGTCMYAYLAIDGASHISEELPNPGRNVPRAMGLTMLIGMITVLPWTIAFLFSTTDTTAVVSSSIPIYTVYLQATSSKSAATFFTVWILFVYSGALVSCMVTTGRLTYAFARDGGLPWSSFFAKISNEVPIRATLGCFLVIALYGLIYIGSTTAFNSFISMSILSLNVTYVVPQAVLLMRGRERILPPRSFSLGRYLGPLCNAIASLWVLMITVLFCFPTAVPTTVQSMNYVSVVVCGITVLIVVAWWGGKRKTFVGPKVELEGIQVPATVEWKSTEYPTGEGKG